MLGESLAGQRDFKRRDFRIVAEDVQGIRQGACQRRVERQGDHRGGGAGDASGSIGGGAVLGARGEGGGVDQRLAAQVANREGGCDRRAQVGGSEVNRAGIVHHDGTRWIFHRDVADTCAGEGDFKGGDLRIVAEDVQDIGLRSGRRRIEGQREDRGGGAGDDARSVGGDTELGAGIEACGVGERLAADVAQGDGGRNRGTRSPRKGGSEGDRAGIVHQFGARRILDGEVRFN